MLFRDRFSKGTFACIGATIPTLCIGVFWISGAAPWLFHKLENIIMENTNMKKILKHLPERYLERRLPVS